MKRQKGREIVREESRVKTKRSVKKTGSQQKHESTGISTLTGSQRRGEGCRKKRGGWKLSVNRVATSDNEGRSNDRERQRERERPNPNTVKQRERIEREKESETNR